MHKTKCNLRIVNKPLKYSPILRQKQPRSNTSVTIVATSFIAGVCLCSPHAISAINHNRVFYHSGSLFGENHVRSGKTSWFGQLGYGHYRTGYNHHRWFDSGDNGRNASGLPQTVPGIALASRRTLGHWFEVELRGKLYKVRQIDVGPARWTGRTIDVNAALADLAGYTPRNFPTDSRIRFRYLGPHEPVPYDEGPKVASLGVEADFPTINRIPPKPKQHTFAELPGRIIGRMPYGLHPVLRYSMLEASKLLPTGYHIHFNNAARESSSVGHHSYHLKWDRLGALAVDVEIIDSHGHRIPNIKSPRNFAIYREFMQHTKKMQYEMFPDYRGRGRWGGYFTTGVSQDLMHYDLGPEHETAAGDWEHGLRRSYGYYGRPTDVGRGMGRIAAYTLPSAPGPFAIIPALAAVTTLPVTIPTRMALGMIEHHRHHRRRFRR